MSVFTVNFTTPHYKNADNAIALGQAWNFQNATVTIPWKDWRTFNFEISIYDDVIHDIYTQTGHLISPYDTFVHVLYRGEPVFWGPITGLDAGGDQNTIRFQCTDPGHYLDVNFIRRGDVALEPPYSTTFPDKASVPLDYRALRILKLGAEAPVDGWPVLGIGNNDNDDADETRTFGIERGQAIGQLWKDISNNTLGPDWELEPLQIQDGGINQNYVHLNTYERLETDYTDVLVWEDGAGQDNADIVWSPGGRLATHVHVLYNDNKNRVTRMNTSAAARYGVHVAWEALDSPDVTEEVAAAWGDSILEAYGHPNNFFTVAPKRDNEMSGRDVPVLHYGDDFRIGDLCTVFAKQGALRTPTISGQIREVRLVQKNETGDVRPELDVVPNTGTYETIVDGD
jgi:hypothetical protein